LGTRWAIERDLGGLDALRPAWASAASPNPFAAPAFLQAMAARHAEAGATPVFAVGRSSEGAAVAVWPLLLGARGELGFLQRGFDDQCGPLASAGVEAGDLAEGLRVAIQESGARGLHLHNVLGHDAGLEAAREALRQLGWHASAFPAWVNPVVTVDQPGEALRKAVSGHKRVRGYANRMAREPGFAFEADEHGEGLDAWARAFADMHDWRWSETPTPSAYTSPRRRDELRRTLQAWHEDGVLVRFTLRTERGPAAMVAGLRAGDRLVYYQVCVSPGAEELRAGHVMLHHIGLWMSARPFRTLDFGAGDEEYKRRYTNAEWPLWRVFGAAGATAWTYLRGRVEAEIRRQEPLGKAWAWARDEVRAPALTRARWLRTRLRIGSAVYPRLPARSVYGLIQSRLGHEREIFYWARGGGGEPGPDVVELGPYDALRLQEGEEGAVLPHDRASTYALAYKGGRAFGVADGGEVLHVSWLTPAPAALLPPGLPAFEGRAWMISRCVTARRARGKGLYPRTLAALIRMVAAQDVVLIYTHDWNVASQRGITKAGFQPLAVRVRAEGETRFEPLP
jgi:CelD/BcsL family acetyltransferase involved in cellulose biosynthesis